MRWLKISKMFLISQKIGEGGVQISIVLEENEEFSILDLKSHVHVKILNITA